MTDLFHIFCAIIIVLLLLYFEIIVDNRYLFLVYVLAILLILLNVCCVVQSPKGSSLHWGFSPGPSFCKTDALPLSYRGLTGVIYITLYTDTTDITSITDIIADITMSIIDILLIPPIVLILFMEAIL